MQPNTPAEAGDRSALEKAAQPKELGEVISYLAKKETSLSNYSDKLRRSVVAVFNQFGSDWECRTCGHQGIAGNHTGFVGATAKAHKFRPKIRLSLDFADKLCRISEEGDDPSRIITWLATQNGSLVLAEAYAADPDILTRNCISPDKASRETLKAVVKSGAIVSFLQQYLDRLIDAEAEYAQVAEVAERLAAVIREPE